MLARTIARCSAIGYCFALSLIGTQVRPAGAQTIQECALLVKALLAHQPAPDSPVVIIAELRAANKSVILPRWYLDALLQEIASRVRTAGLHYDPLLDTEMAILLSRANGAVPYTALGTNGSVLITALGVSRPTNAVAGRETIRAARAAPSEESQTRSSAEYMVERGQQPNAVAEASSPISRLAAAVTVAQADGALPALPPDSRDSVVLSLTLRPQRDSALPPTDSSAVRVPLFQANGLHSGRAAGVFYSGEVSEPAVPRRDNRVAPRYPDERRRSGEEGGVLAYAIVDANGEVERNSIGVVVATPGFDRAALVMDGLRYTPAKVSGCPVRSIVTQSFLFRIAH